MKIKIDKEIDEVKITSKIFKLECLVDDLYEAGQLKKAISTTKRICDLYKSMDMEDNPYFILNLDKLANLYIEISAYGEAEPLLCQILESIGSEWKIDYLKMLNKLAQIYLFMGAYEKAESSVQKAIDSFKKYFWEKNSNEHLDSLMSLVNALTYQKEEPSGETNPIYIQSLNILGDIYLQTGAYGKAEPLLHQALEIETKKGEGDHLNYIGIITSLAELYHHIGSYEDAESLLHQALEHLKETKGEKDPNYVKILNNLASTYNRKGENRKAESLVHQTLEIVKKTYGEKHDDYAHCLHILAGLYFDRGAFKEAEPLILQALQIEEKIFGNTHPSFLHSLNLLACLYQSMGFYLKAETLYRQILKSWGKNLGEKSLDYAIVLINLVWCLVARGQSGINDVFELIKKTGRVHDYLIGQISSIASENQFKVYLQHIRHHFDIALTLVCQNLSLHQKAIFWAFERVLKSKSLGVEALAVKRDTVLGGRYPELIPKFKEKNELGLKIIQKELSGPGLDGKKNHKELLSQWRAEKEALESEIVRQVPEMNLEIKLKEVDRQVIAESLPPNSTLVEFVKFNVFDFKAVSTKREVQWKPARYLAFILSAGEADKVQMIDLGETESIDQKIDVFRKRITGEKDNRGIKIDFEEIQTVNQGIGEELRKILFDPIISKVNGNKVLFISPDGDLYRLPFEVLPAKEEGTCLIDHYMISYLGTGRDLLRIKQPFIRTPVEDIVAAYPDFDLSADGDGQDKGEAKGLQPEELQRSGLKFDPLPETRVEGEKIGVMLGVRPWLLNEVLDSKLKNCYSPRILHLATHGFFLEDQKGEFSSGTHDRALSGSERGISFDRLYGPAMGNPLLRSGLALAGINTWLENGSLPPEAEDGLLTAADVTGLDLLDTELVVLSACETGLGEVTIGEGVMGLRRSFVVAGARALVMSLWKVPDCQTQELMENFYTKLLTGQSKAEALRQAQLDLKKKYPHPYYWGAFICQGDPGPLVNGKELGYGAP